MANNRPTMQDIANQLGVSKNSVYLALNAKPGVSAALRERTLEAARGMGYGVFTEREIERKSRCVILVIPEYLQNDVFFYADIVWSIDTEAARLGLVVIKRAVTQAERGGLIMPALPADMAVVGFLVIGVLSEAYVSGLYQTALPVLSVDIPYYDAPVGCVCTANHAGGYAAARYLIQKGHRRIGFVGPVYAARSVYERWSGFRQAMEESGLAADAPYNIIGQPGRFELFDTQEALQPLFNRVDTYPSAWFCAGDRIALTTMNLLTLKGLRVPGDVSVMGFDDLSVAQMVLPKLTTMRVRRRHMGQLAVQQLLRCAEQRQTLTYIALPCTLVERDSVKTLDKAADEAS
ncbi:MAG: LacI family DNA-binding transcriptional regulator [Oscillospiraceae bacterium]|jgi:LacI family transcriptional regulator/LacI family purine nucleotide synthesis repressor|nr:LacI family DNA-binding transcriptional regulator [Oscillospiraceae bacterium]